MLTTSKWHHIPAGRPLWQLLGQSQTFLPTDADQSASKSSVATTRSQQSLDHSGGHIFGWTAAQVTATAHTHYHWVIWRVTNGSANESWGLGRLCKKLLQFWAGQISNRGNIYQSGPNRAWKHPPLPPHPVHIYQPSAFVVRHILPFSQVGQCRFGSDCRSGRSDGQINKSHLLTHWHSNNFVLYVYFLAILLLLLLIRRRKIYLVF